MLNNLESAKKMEVRNSFINSFLALVFSLLLGAIFIWVCGYSPIESYKAIIGVSLGTVITKPGNSTYVYRTFICTCL